MNTRDLDTGKKIVEMTKNEVHDACRLYCKLANISVPKEAKLFKLGSYSEVTAAQFEYALSD